MSLPALELETTRARARSRGSHTNPTALHITALASATLGDTIITALIYTPMHLLLVLLQGFFGQVVQEENPGRGSKN